jgi:hypothetical protein
MQGLNRSVNLMRFPESDIIHTATLPYRRGKRPESSHVYYWVEAGCLALRSSTSFANRWMCICWESSIDITIGSKSIGLVALLAADA